VAVCPTGVDIRDGFQLECIGCGLCIDACDEVMGRIGRPPKLIAYDSERNQDLRATGEGAAYRLLRPRTLLYIAMITTVALTILVVLGLRSPVDVNILPDHNPLFVTLSDGSIRNGYTIRVMNKEHVAKEYLLTLQGGGRISVQGREGQTQGVPLTAPPDGFGTHRVFVQVPRQDVKAEQSPLTFLLEDTATGKVSSYPTIFRGPKP
jgi:polyferredoxin